MYITRKDYDDKPVLIKQGALLLWGIPLAKWVSKGQVRCLYLLNDFYAEMCYDQNTGQLTSISTFTSDLYQAAILVPVRSQNLPLLPIHTFHHN